MRFKPENSIAIVTGASSGIGKCLCELLVARGATVVATARRQHRLDDLVQSTLKSTLGPGSIIPVVGDLTDPMVRRKVIDVACQVDGGRIDLLINNAGIGAIGPFADASAERLRQIMEVNFFAPLELTRSCLPFLRKGRSPVICNIGSVLGHRAVPNKSEYCASKFAMHGFSDSLRAELVTDNIQVTLVSPSTTRSEFFDSLVDTEAGQSSKSFGSWPPEKVARTTLAAIQARRSEVILSLGGKALVYADRIAPPIMNAILGVR
ncbi:3-oxoacyl-[acyl-carrier-protein] reductase FabG [Rubripirellula obstinata]|uniref:3-oxoacyl-[acyl-carrier-protein] reductase FabG n=1 Tax=Rubripirellula obstinata TaxID=406547 RepID=A0A5B1CD47_9BACT|nr:SDR family NAD(P)-dependent oxidoreductase [Rubripirellula obstinata]KAA1259047.1 3-oxoacyl-[acyl-carrier-protein] reductase FabG [Rubripirellula obstinata]